MKLSDIRAPYGYRRRTKRRGRGPGSGHGKTSCRGHKGAKSRSGPGTHMGFEGGQMPLIRRIPKRGFRHVRNTVVQIVNMENLNVFDNGAVIDAALLKDKGLIHKTCLPVKVLGKGKIGKSITVRAQAFSGSAKSAIEAAGGKTEITPLKAIPVKGA
ncbi:MAG: 50S ribosomal protein L15 [Candidatus Omnitrophota bacterium]